MIGGCVRRTTPHMFGADARSAIAARPTGRAANSRYSNGYLHIPIADVRRLGVGPFDAIIDAIAENIRWGKVLLHCESGASSAPVMAAAWMHAVGYKNIDGALEEIAGLRPFIAPSGILLSSVRGHLQ
jgi:hypothetical protein